VTVSNFVLSTNIQRRDLTAAQRAVVAARALEHIPERRGRPSAGEKVDGPSILSRQSVSQVFKVGEKAVRQAKALLADAPDLAAQVGSCTLSLAAAYDPEGPPP
jgi:hypothetical protein